MFFVVEMPYNKDGDGPEMDASKVTRVEYQVWDENYLCHTCTHIKKEAEDWIKLYGKNINS